MKDADKQLAFINVSKGIGIILVVVGHAIIPAMRRSSDGALAVYEFIYSFHMALFFLISGYLFQKGLERYRAQGFKAFLWAKFRTLMIPYFTFSVVIYLVLGLAQVVYPPVAALMQSTGKTTGFSLPQALFQILTNEDHVDFHLWYVYSLFLIFIICYLGYRYYSRAVGLVVSVGLLYITYLFQLPSIVQMTLRFLFYFCLGGNTALVDKVRVQKRLAIPLAAVFIAYGVFCLNLEQILPKYAWVTVRNLFALCAIALIFILSETLGETRAGNAFSYFGVRSYEIYLLHQPYIAATVSNLLLAATGLPYIAIILISAVLGLLIPIPISKYILQPVGIFRFLFLGGRTRKRPIKQNNDG